MVHSIYVILKWPEKQTQCINVPAQGSLRYPLLYYHEQNHIRKSITWIPTHSNTAIDAFSSKPSNMISNTNKVPIFVIEQWPEKQTQYIDVPAQGSLRYPLLYNYSNPRIGWTKTHPGCHPNYCLCLIDESNSTIYRGIYYDREYDIRLWDLDGTDKHNAITDENIDTYASRCHLKYVDKKTFYRGSDIYDIGLIELPYGNKNIMFLHFKRQAPKMLTFV
jgi:hypothetical protein